MPNTYKDVEIPSKLVGLIDHMRDVESYREELHNLGSQWDLLTILGEMSGTGTDMTATRVGFQELSSELLSQLGLETLKKAVQDISSKSQVAVDVVIRNLFERTADIGFLSTDDDIREFLILMSDLSHQLRHNPTFDEKQRINTIETEQRSKIVERFQEYVAKYSVYFNIMLLDTQGNVLAQLDENSQVEHSSDSLIQEALSTQAEYVEVYRQTDLLPNNGDSLLYAFRVTETNDSYAKPLGVLVLSFRFENEMEGIFNSISSPDDWAVMTLLNESGVVIASSDPYHVPVGASLPFDTNSDYHISRFAGRQYLSKTCATKGYQGFQGLGWYGHVMTPLDQAFNVNQHLEPQNKVSQAILDAVMSDPRLFSENLRSIPTKADKIQSDLERTVWNGNVRENDSQSKVLLWNISDAGARTKKVFEQSIGNLHETVVDSILTDVAFYAALSVDIMDRNLYERANDCRWWALTSKFRKIMAQAKISSTDVDTMSAILEYINDLYTVYTNLFVYDATGKIIAVSDSAQAGLQGTVLNQQWVKQTLGLRNTQQYSVSAFEPTQLYDNRHTYIYGAAIQSFNDTLRCVGGIGIVFDSEPEFKEMLLDSLPRSSNGDIVEGCFGVFVDANGLVVSSTKDELQVGDTLDIDSNFLSLQSNCSSSTILPYNGHYYAVGAHSSTGYREYKLQDGYSNHITGLIFVPLAELSASQKQKIQRRNVDTEVTTKRFDNEVTFEFATFYVGEKWLGLHAELVIEAVTVDCMSPSTCANPFVVGKILYKDELVPVVKIKDQINTSEALLGGNAPVIIAAAGEHKVGILADSLGEIPQVALSRIESKSNILEASTSYIESIVKPDAQSSTTDLLVIIDPLKLITMLTGKI